MKVSRFLNLLDKFLDVPSTDPDDARRRKLLNILLAGVALLATLAILASMVFRLFKDNLTTVQEEGALLTIYTGVALLFGSALFYLLNRYVAGWLASFLFLAFLLVALSLSDTPLELATGRSLFVYTIPVVIASVLLKPESSFIFAALSSVAVTILAKIAIVETNQIAIIGFFFLAIVSWLSSRSLEQALRELRVINVNLDKIVAERTHALAEALTRERIEAGRSQAILESIADGVIVFNTQGNAIQANPALSNLINVPFSNLINITVNDLIESSPMDAKSRGTLAGILITPDKQPVSHRVEWGQKTISVSSGQVLDRDGSEVGTVAVFRDFTKEAELEKMKSAFVAMVSHELRTPLSAILGYAEIFQEQIYGPLNEKQLNTTNRIISNSRRLLGLINDLLDQAQMEAGKLKIKYETIKPSDLLVNLHSVMDKLTTDKGLALQSELDDDMPETLIGDSARLQQILVNLVNNAAKFTDSGSINVKIFKVDDKFWGMIVKDTGKGIPKEELPYIFDAFRQVEGTTTRVHGGFGLGLSIVKQLVSLMGGSTTVESELDQGSIFTITLPFEQKR